LVFLPIPQQIDLWTPTLRITKSDTSRTTTNKCFQFKHFDAQLVFIPN